MIEIILPYYLYDTETGRCREFDLTNPADVSMYALYSNKVINILVDWDSFDAWAKYCNKDGLKLNDSDLSVGKSKSLLEYLELFAKRGGAIMFWGDGQFKVVYDMPIYASGRILKIGIGNRVYYKLS